MTCPEGSIRLAPPLQNQMKPPHAGTLVNGVNGVFALTDGTQLLPDMSVRGRDKIITRTDGSQVRPTLGAEIDWVDDGHGGRENVCVVRRVTPNSPFHKAGIEDDDVCEQWDNTPLDSKSKLVACLENAFPGQVVNVMVNRGGHQQAKKVRGPGARATPLSPSVSMALEGAPPPPPKWLRTVARGCEPVQRDLDL